MSHFDDRLWSQLVHEHGERMRAAPRATAALAASTDYRPGARLLRPSVAIGGGLAIAVGAIAIVLSLAGGTSDAFAGWTPKPTAPTRAQLATTEAYCSGSVPFPGLPLKLLDTRGPFTFAIYSDGTSNDFCTTGPSFTNASGWRTSPPATAPAGKLYLWDEHTTTDGGQAYTSVIAQAGDGVSAATLTIQDGTEVTATVQNGWAVAWWPGSHQVTGARLTTPSGVSTQTFALSPCGHQTHPCSGGPHGAAPDGGPGGG